MRHITFNPVRQSAFGLLITLFFTAPVGLAATMSLGQTPISSEVTASAIELGRAFSEVAEALRPTVVFIRKEARRGAFVRRTGRGPTPSATSSGTGFIVREDGHIVTNYHVIAGARQIFVRLYDKREYRARVVGSDLLTDLAVLKIEEIDLPTAEFGNSDELRVGHWVIAIGNPLGRALSFSVTAGIVSATRRTLVSGWRGARTVLDYIQTDAVANTGNSGGPLIDLRGKIVGVNAAIFSTTGAYQGYTLAIPANLVAPIVERLIEDGTVRRTGLGVSVEDATVEDAVAVGMDSVQGVVVQDVSLGGGAARRAGLRDGDVIVAVDGEPIMSTAQLQRAVWFRWAGDLVRVSIRREGGVERWYHVPLQWLTPVAPEESEVDRDDWAAPPCSDNPLGVCLVETSAESAENPKDTDDATGLFVESVYSVGPSFGKLVPDADIITHVNGVRVRSMAELEAVLSDCLAGQIVAVKTVRTGTGKRGFTRVRLQG